MRTRHACPSCGLIIVIDEEARAFLHELPECDWSRAINSGASETKEVLENDLEGHLDDLRARFQKARS